MPSPRSFFVMPCWNLSALIFLSAGAVPARCFTVIKPSTSLPTSLLVLLSAYLCSYVSCILWHPLLLIRRFLLSCSLIFTATLSLLFYAGYSYNSLFLSAVLKLVLPFYLDAGLKLSFCWIGYIYAFYSACAKVNRIMPYGKNNKIYCSTNRCVSTSVETSGYLHEIIHISPELVHYASVQQGCYLPFMFQCSIHSEMIALLFY